MAHVHDLFANLASEHVGPLIREAGFEPVPGRSARVRRFARWRDGSYGEVELLLGKIRGGFHGTVSVMLWHGFADLVTALQDCPRGG